VPNYADRRPENPYPFCQHLCQPRPVQRRTCPVSTWRKSASG
jgi:hypothetical protein